MSEQIDLSNKNIVAYAQKVPGLNAIFSSMESVERWVFAFENDQPLGEFLEDRFFNLTKPEVEQVSNRLEPLLWVMFFLPTRSAFYLLDSLKRANEDLPSQLLELAISFKSQGEGDVRHAQVFIDRLAQLNASSFLTAISDESFVAKLEHSIKKTGEESGYAY